MDFRIKVRKQNIPEEELLEDLRKAASPSRYHQRLRDLRLSPLPVREGVVILTENQYRMRGKYGVSTICKRFGTWARALERAGLRCRSNLISYEDLLENLRQAWLKMGRQPTHNDLKPPVSKYRGHLYTTAFGSWVNALEMFSMYVNDREAYDKLKLKRELKRKTTNGRRRRKPGRHLRYEVLKRDNYTCKACGRSPATNPGLGLEADHIVPYSKGGETIMDNLQTLCEDCNMGKSNRE